MSIKRRIAKWIFHHLSGNPDEYCVPPGANSRLDFGEYDNIQVARTHCNDGFELWLGTYQRWYTFYQAKEARRLAWFILWEWWMRDTWFGLKRKLWYWALHEQCKSKTLQEQPYLQSED